MFYELIIKFNTQSNNEEKKDLVQKFHDCPCINRCRETQTVTITGDGFYFLFSLSHVESIAVMPLAIQGD